MLTLGVRYVLYSLFHTAYVIEGVNMFYKQWILGGGRESRIRI